MLHITSQFYGRDGGAFRNSKRPHYPDRSELYPNIMPNDQEGCIECGQPSNGPPLDECEYCNKPYCEYCRDEHLRKHYEQLGM